MASSTKFSLSLPEPLFAAAERVRTRTGETRSRFFRRALEELLRQERQRDAVERYVAGYVAEPETPYEVEEVDEISNRTIAGDPWS